MAYEFFKNIKLKTKTLFKIRRKLSWKKIAHPKIILLLIWRKTLYQINQIVTYKNKQGRILKFFES